MKIKLKKQEIDWIERTADIETYLVVSYIQRLHPNLNFCSKRLI